MTENRSVTSRCGASMASRGPSEGQLQRAIVKESRRRWSGISIMASASGAFLAGGKKSGRLLRLSGVEAGDPDLHVREWGRNGEPGAYVELKVPGGVVSAAQHQQHASLRSRGYAVFVLYSQAEFMSSITEYLPRDFDAADAAGNTERAGAVALGLRADRRSGGLEVTDGAQQHSARVAPLAPADSGTSTDDTVAPKSGSADAPIDLEPELSDAGAELGGGAEAGGGGVASMTTADVSATALSGTWAAVVLAGGQATEGEVSPEAGGQYDPWAWDGVGTDWDPYHCCGDGYTSA